jgi:hypothetical protein
MTTWILIYHRFTLLEEPKKNIGSMRSADFLLLYYQFVDLHFFSTLLIFSFKDCKDFTDGSKSRRLCSSELCSD